MELKEQQIWMVVRVRKYGHGSNITCLHAYTTEEEANEKLKEYATCKGHFEVVPTQTWFPSEE